ncbi:MAG: hypothetical protein ACFFD2_20475 [Promethearchaeota archaeon]
MNVKGLAFIQIKTQITYVFGKERWNIFFNQLKESNSFFNLSILATTKIPINEYLVFVDTMLKEFYKNDKKVFWKMGKDGATTSLAKDGPFRVFLKRKRNPQAFINSILPRIWNLYFDEGYEKFLLDKNIMYVYIFNLPIYHVYFEYTTMGYIERALELFGVTIKKIIKLLGSTKEIHYKLVLDL